MEPAEDRSRDGSRDLWEMMVGNPGIVRPHSALGYRPPAPEARSWPRLALSPRSELELLAARN